MAQAGAAGAPRGQAGVGVSARQTGRRWRSGAVTFAVGPSVGPCGIRSDVAGNLPEGAGSPGFCPGCGNADRTPGSGMVPGAESRFPTKMFKSRVFLGFSAWPIPTKIPSRRSDVRVRFRQGADSDDGGCGIRHRHRLPRWRHRSRAGRCRRHPVVHQSVAAGPGTAATKDMARALAADLRDTPRQRASPDLSQAAGAGVAPKGLAAGSPGARGATARSPHVSLPCGAAPRIATITARGSDPRNGA